MTVNPPRKRVSLLGHDFVTCNVLGLHVLLNKPMEVEAPFNFLLCYGNTGTQTHTKKIILGLILVVFFLSVK